VFLVLVAMGVLYSRWWVSQGSEAKGLGDAVVLGHHVGVDLNHDIGFLVDRHGARTPLYDLLCGHGAGDVLGDTLALTGNGLGFKLLVKGGVVFANPAHDGAGDMPRLQ